MRHKLFQLSQFWPFSQFIAPSYKGCRYRGRNIVLALRSGEILWPTSPPRGVAEKATSPAERNQLSTTPPPFPSLSGTPVGFGEKREGRCTVAGPLKSIHTSRAVLGHHYESLRRLGKAERTSGSQ